MNYKYQLGHISEENKESGFSLGEAISDELFKKIEESVDEIVTYLETLDLYGLVKLNERNLLDFFPTALEEVKTKSIKWNGVTDDDLRRLKLEVNGRLLNYLNSIRTYLDHSETSFKREFGGESGDFKEFKTITSHLFDNNFAYRFFYKLRNYAQHCGLPVHSIGYSVNNNNGIIRVNINPRLVRVKLLEKFDWGAKVRKDLTEMNTDIELIPLLLDLVKQISLLDEKIKRINLENILLTANYLNEQAGHLRGANLKVCLFHGFIQHEDGRLTFSVKYIPFDIIDDIIQNDSGEKVQISSATDAMKTERTRE